MKEKDKPTEADSSPHTHRSRSIPVALLMLFVMLLSAGSGIYAGASFVAQQSPNVTVTTTIFTTTTSWTTSTIWSTVTEVAEGVLTIVEYTTSTNTMTVTSMPTSNYGDTNVESTSRGVAAGYAFAATKFTTSSATTLTQLRLYFYASPVGNIKFAVYHDKGGTPAGQSLVGQTNGYPIGAGGGWHTYTLASDTIYVDSAGTYWLCLLLSSNNNAHFKSKGFNTGRNYMFPQSYTSGFPATFAASPIAYAYGDYSLYAVGSP